MKHKIKNEIILKLFISIDLIGSTTYKNKKPMNYKNCELFYDFYDSMPRNIYEEMSDIYKEFKNPEYFDGGDVPLPRLFKILGDEVIIEIDLISFEDVPIILVGLKNAINRFRDNPVSIDLDLKTTVWISSFPIINKEMSIPRSPSVTAIYRDDEKLLNDIFLDQIRPSIAIRFRLRTSSTANLITISLEVAYILVYIAETTNNICDWESIQIVHKKIESLKGVYDGKPYPIIWIENLTELEEARKRIIGNISKPEHSLDRHPDSYRKLYNYCDKYINEINDRNLLSEPYIVEYLNSGQIKVSEGVLPKEHRKQINKMDIIIS